MASKLPRNVPISAMAKYFMPMGTYGFYRGFTFTQKSYEYDNTDILLSDRIASGVFNTFMYANPITHPFYLGNLMDRIEIKLSNKDPTKYRSSYREVFNYNYKTI
jgi:hypothetical protein